jgi:hypothetical protein
MAVIDASQITVKPGRYQDFLKLTDKAQAVLEKCGAKNMRLIAPLHGGGPTGTVSFAWEADDFAKHGKVLDDFFAQGGSDLLMEYIAEDSPIAGWSTSVLVDIQR